MNGSDEEAVSALLGQWGISEDDARKEPSDTGEAKKTTQADDTVTEDNTDSSEREDAPEAEGEDEGEQETETEDESTKSDDPLDITIKQLVDGEEREFKVRDLARLAGQEASLTRKSQEVAERRKAVDTAAVIHLKQHDAMLERARARWEPFSKINWMTLTKDPNITPEEATAVQEQANAAWSDLKFLEGSGRELHEQINTQRRDTLREQAAEAIKVLTDPEKGIKGFNEQMYTDIQKFARDVGVPQEAVAELVDPSAIKIIHMAMLYKRSQNGKVKTTPSKNTSAPKKIIKTSHNRDAVRSQTGGKADAADAMQRLKRSGSDKDAVAAMMARWSVED